MKHIDAEKLKEKINEVRKDWLGDSTGLEVGEFGAVLGAAESILDSINEIIDSLQQEQSDKPKKNCNNCPHCVDKKDQYGLHFKGCFGGTYNGKFIAEIDKCPLKQEQPNPTCKTCGFYENNCPFIRGTFKPYPNKVCKDYTYSDMKIQHSKPFSCGHENGGDSEKQEQPSLPYNLDEAAEKYGRENIILPDYYNDGDIDFYAEETGKVFKDGAQWMARQMKQEQPDVDLEEEVKKYFQGLWPGTEKAEQCNTDMHFTPLAILRMVDYFYELGLNTRKEESK